jgi:hypothetical protein
MGIIPNAMYGGLNPVHPSGLGAAWSLLGPPSSQPSLLGGLASPQSLLSLPRPFPWQWFFVRERFNRFLSNLKITDWQREDGEKKQAGVRACLNRHYWGYSSETANSFLIGSWGKHTRVRPSRDIDVLFLLPPQVYWRFQSRQWNKQSQLLQEVKDVLIQTYSQTSMRADGQVVVIPFNSILLEVAVGFRCEGGSIIVCDTNNQGFYKTSTAEAEFLDISLSDTNYNGNTRALVRMMKCWQRENNIPLKSFHLERLVITFMSQWIFNKQDEFYYDWMIKDFFLFLLGQAGNRIVMPLTGEIIPLGNDWVIRASKAYQHAINACNNERENYEILAGLEWQAIFGNSIPKEIS